MGRTSAPWAWVYDGSSDYSIGRADDPQGLQVAHVYDRNPDRAHATCNLIAAASDMLSVLKQIEFMSGGRPRCPMCAGWMASPNGETDRAHSKTCELDAAIKKAEGRS